jgi:hypothetical protein
MIFFWLPFSSCALLAWLIGYGRGYFSGIREAIAANASASDTDPVGIDRD